MAAQPPLQFGPYRLEGASGQLWRHTQVVKLPPKATAVLWCLVRQAGQVVTKATLLDTVWARTVVSEGVLTVCIRDLRRALGDDAKQPRYIETVHRRGYRFVAPVVPLQEPPPAPDAPPAPPLPAALAPPGLMGRAAEVAQVQACLERAWGGQRHVLFVTGEAGIGKTTLVDACVQKVEAHGGGWVGWGQCVDAYGPGTGYLPVLEALGRLCRGPAGPTVLPQLRQWAPAWLAQLSGVLDAAEQARLQRRTLGTPRERLLRELAEALEALTQAHLLVLVLEDLHWSDPSTVDVLTMLARRREAARLLILGTYRPVELMLRRHPLKSAMAELHLHGHCTELALPYLAEAAVAAYVASHFPAPVAQVVAPMIYQRTGGHPLFMVHLAAYLAQQAERETHAGGEVAARVVAVADTIPAGVQQLIELQLEHLRADEQGVLAMASVAGVAFAVASVAAGLQMSPDLSEELCATLAQRGQFLEACGLAVWPDGTVSGQYRFRHAVYQQVLYRQVAEVRQVQGHRRIGARLEVGYGTRTAEIAMELAGHFERGQDTERAITYHTQAGQQALERSAHQEAIGHLTTGLALLATLPETPARAQQELALQITLGPALIATQGYASAEVEQTYSRAQVLCQQVDDPQQRFSTLRGLRTFYHARGEIRTGYALEQQLLSLARQQQDPALLLEAHEAAGLTLFCLGELPAARAALEQSMALYDPQQHRTHVILYGRDTGAFALSYMAMALGLLGYPDQALRRGHEALALAQERSHPYSLAVALAYRSVVQQFRRDAQAVYEQAEAAMTYAMAQGFPYWAARGPILCGWALMAQGRPAAGLARLQQGLTAWQATGAGLLRSYWAALLAEAYGQVGQHATGLQVLDEVLPLADKAGERFWFAELHRLKGELLLAPSGVSQHEAERCFHQAIAVARRQQAKSLELRATISLCRLWQRQRKQQAACDLLAPVYDWFTEGFDTADLQEARALLEDLA